MRLTPLASDHNTRTATSLAKYARILDVRRLEKCTCGADATCDVGQYARCQPCANDIVNKWNEIRANLDEVKGDF